MPSRAAISASGLSPHCMRARSRRISLSSMTSTTMKPPRLAPLCLLVLLVSVATVVHAGGSTDKLTGLSSKSIAAFVDAFASKHVPSRVPGISVAVVKDGKTLYSGGAGQADQSTSRDVSATTPMRVGSLSQLLTLIAVLQQKDAQRLALTDPIDSFLPAGAIPNPPASVGIPDHVSIRDALAHAGGWEAKSMGLWAPKTKMPANASVAMNEFPRRVRPQGAAPLAYSPHAYVALGHAVQQIVEQDLVEYLNDQVMAPLGMNVGATASVRGHELSPQSDADALAMGYSAVRGAGFAPVDVYGTSPATTGLCASAADMAQVLKVFTNEGKVNGNQLLAKDSVEECLTPQVSGFPGVPLDDGAGATLGWFEHPVGSVKALVHPGDAPGFASLAAVFPDDHLGVFFSANADTPGVRHEFLTEFIKEFSSGTSSSDSDEGSSNKKDKSKKKTKSKSSSSSSAPVTGVNLQAYVGHYKPVQSSHTMWEAAAHVLSQIRVTLSPSGQSLIVTRVNAADLTTSDLVATLTKATTTLGGGHSNTPALPHGSIELVPVRVTTVAAKEPGQRGGQVVVFHATTPGGDVFTAAVYPGGTEVNAPRWYLTTNALGHGYLASFQPIGFFEAASFVLPTMTYGLGVMAAYMVIWLVKGLVGPLVGAGAGGKSDKVTASQANLALANAALVDGLTAAACMSHLMFVALVVIGVWKNGGVAAVLAMQRLPISLRLVFFGPFICQIMSVALAVNVIQDIKQYSPLQLATSGIVAVASLAVMMAQYTMRMWILNV